MIALIHNPKAGGADDGDLLNQVRTTCEAANVKAKAYDAKDLEDATKDGCEILCAMGGDGTVHAVANAILRDGGHAKLAILPLGTGNFIAKALGIPSDAEAAINTMLHGKTQELDVGKLNDDYFLLGIGIGLTEKVISESEDKEKDKYGSLAYLTSFMRGRKHPAFHVSLAGEVQHTMERAQSVTVLNFAGIGTFEAIEGSAPDDGKMEVVMARRLGVLDTLRAAFLAAIGKLPAHPGVTVRSSSSIEITTKPALPIQVDGDDSDLHTPIRIEVMARALRVLVPTE